MNNSLPLGFKHWSKDDPSLYIEWGILLFIASLKNLFGVKTYEAKHMKEVTPWIVRKLEGASMAKDLLVNIISVLVHHSKKKGRKILYEIELSVRLYYLRMRVRLYLIKEKATILMRSYLSKRYRKGL